MKIDWPEDLVRDIARRRCIVVAGSGVSAHAINGAGDHPKTWAALIDRLLEGVPRTKFVSRLKKQFDYLTLCEIAEHHFTRHVIGNRLREEFVVPAFKATLIHERLFDLDARVVATPNFDKIYETFACHKADGTIAVKTYDDPDIAECLRGDGRVILKIHGTIDTPAKCILTRNDYSKARSKYRHFYDLLFSLFVTSSILFIGCGFSDPDIRLLLEDSKFRFQSNSPHYFVVPQDECNGEYKDVLEGALNIRTICFSKKNGYKELVDGLGELVVKVEAGRDKLRESGNW